MSKTWDALLPRPEKFILLAYADHAADEQGHGAESPATRSQRSADHRQAGPRAYV